MKTTRKRERDRARGENNIFSTREQDFSLRGLWIFFFFFSSFLLSFFFFFFVVVTDISPHFPRDQKSILDHPFNIKSGRYLYTQQTQFAAAILRSSTDVSLTDNKDPFLSFFFFKAATGRATPARVPEGRKTDAALSFFLFPSLLFRNEYWHWVPVISSVTFIGVFIRQTLGAVFMPQQRPATPLNCHPRLAPKQSEVESHFLMVTQAMRPGNWTVGGSLSAHHMTCLKSL